MVFFGLVKNIIFPGYSQKQYVDCASLEPPPEKIWTPVERVKFVIRDFQTRNESPANPLASSLFERSREFIQSPVLKAHGHYWTIGVHLGRHPSEPKFSFVFGLRSPLGPKFLTTKMLIGCKECKAFWEGKIENGAHLRRRNSFLEREDVLKNFLEEDGSLVIEAEIQIKGDDNSVWYPKELQKQEIWVQLYEDARSKSSDVVFLVGGTLYRAHSLILSVRCKKLYELTREGTDHTPIPLAGTRGEVFKKLLDFVYTVQTPEVDDVDAAAELLRAADQFECVQLKIYMESVITDRFLCAETAASLLLLADAQSCALLKEAATRVFFANAETVKSSFAWAQIKESTRLLGELLDSVISPRKCETGEADRLTVTALRRELEKVNLELDGSRIVLVDRLKCYRQWQDQNPM